MIDSIEPKMASGPYGGSMRAEVFDLTESVPLRRR